MLNPPAPRPQLLVFTDLDGTLLDHADYSYAPAQPALAALQARGIPLVLASSKTAAEIERLHEALGLGSTPAIVENGAGVLRSGRVRSAEDDHARLRAALATLPPDLRQAFRGFSDMSPQEVSKLTGLAAEDAVRAKDRQFSEPGIWLGGDAALEEFRARLAAQGIAAQQGGRFLTLSFGATKADRIAEIAADYGTPCTLALGDAPNDIAMLEAADFGVIIRNDHGPGIPPLAGEADGRITRTARPGPSGWNDAVLDFLETHACAGDPASHG